MAAFYRNLHTFFAPLHKPLSNSTDPAKVAARIADAAIANAVRPATSSAVVEQQPIYDLVHDPRNMTLHTSIPNIPEPGTLSAEGLSDASSWSRVEAINVHSQILATVAETCKPSAADQLERTAKTSRGWWVVWMRVNTGHSVQINAAEHGTSNNLHLGSLQESVDSRFPTSRDGDAVSVEPVKSITASYLNPDTADDDEEASDPEYRDVVPAVSTKSNPSATREAILIRRARDASASSGSKSGARGASGMWTSIGLGAGTASSARAGGQQAGWGPARLAEGIGVDARRYVEGLLSLNR